MRIVDNICDLTPEVHKALSSTSYTGKNMKNENDILMINKIIRDYTSTGDRDSRRKIFFRKPLPKLVQLIQNKTFDEIPDDSEDLQGEGVKIIIPSNIIDNYSRLKTLLGSKHSGPSDTLTETI